MVTSPPCGTFEQCSLIHQWTSSSQNFLGRRDSGNSEHHHKQQKQQHEHSIARRMSEDSSTGSLHMVSGKRLVVRAPDSFQSSDLLHTVSNGESIDDDDHREETQNYFESIPTYKKRTTSANKSIRNRSALICEQSEISQHLTMAPPQKRTKTCSYMPPALRPSTSYNTVSHTAESSMESNHQLLAPIQRQPQTYGSHVDAGWMSMLPLTSNESSQWDAASLRNSLLTDQNTCLDTAAAVAALLDLTPSVNGDQAREPTSGPRRNPTIPTATDHQRSFPKTTAVPEQRPPSVDRDIGAYMAITSFDLASRSRQLLFDVPVTDKACKCKNTHCLKLYCTCFQTGTFCDPDLCTCKDCNNMEEFNGRNGSRPHAISQILKRRIDAFEPRLKKKTGEGCACKKSRSV